MWIDHFRNGQSARGAFGDAIPDLKHLDLLQLVFNPPIELALSLNCHVMPNSIPHRWKERGYDRLQFRMNFGLEGDLVMQGKCPAATQKTEIQLETGILRVISADGNFRITANYHEGILYFYPYKDSEFEFPPIWFHQ
jgi:hypothetical protein